MDGWYHRDGNVFKLGGNKKTIYLGIFGIILVCKAFDENPNKH